MSFRRPFIIAAFLFALAGTIAAPGLPAEKTVAPASPAVQQAAKRSNVLEPAVRSCRVDRREFFSDACGAQMAYYAFVPQRPEEAAPYPVLYLLHGAFDCCTAWKDHAEDKICELASQYRIIIVTPEGGCFGWYADSKFEKNNQVETYFLKELIPDVEKSYPTNGRRSIAGLSMGGHGAFVLSLRNPGEFTSVSSMSGILDITRHKTHWHLAEVFGPYEGENVADWDQHSALKLLKRSEDYIRALPMLITVSSGDQLAIDDNRLVHKQLEKMKVEHTYRESPGGHDWVYWTSQLERHVSFHAQWLLRAVKGEE